MPVRWLRLRSWRRAAACAAGCAVLGIASGARAEGGIAVAGPMKGAYAAIGAAIRGAIPGDAVQIVEDDGCQAEAAIAAAQRIASARPAVVIGHPCSSAAIAAAPIYAAAQIPFIATGARHGDLTDKRAGPLVFRLAGRDDRQGKTAAEFLARVSSAKPIAILHDRTFAMSTIAGDAAVALTGPAEAPPAPRVMQLPFVASELQYDALIAKVLAFAGAPHGLGAVLFAGYPAEAIVILRALRARGVTAPFLAVDANATRELGTNLGAATRDVFVLDGGDAASNVAAQTAAALRLWTAAVAREPANPGAALAAVDADDPALGRITFDAKGDAVVPSYFICAWRDGAWKPVATPGAEQTPPP